MRKKNLVVLYLAILGMAVQSLREHRPVEVTVTRVVQWAAICSAYAVAWRWVFKNYPPRLNAASKKLCAHRDKFCCEASQCMVAITLHTFLGPLALYTSIIYASGTAGNGICAFASPHVDPFWLDVDSRVCLLGEIFAGNMIYQVLFWLLRWETGIDMLVHHVGFLLAGVLILAIVAFGKIAAFAMAMEVSSPFLSLHLLARQLDGRFWEIVAHVSAALFGLLFIIARICLFGYAILELHYLYWLRPEVFPSWLPPATTRLVLITFTMAWLLQFFWGRLVVAKVAKAIQSLFRFKQQDEGVPAGVDVLFTLSYFWYRWRLRDGLATVPNGKS